jgi:flagellar protein FlaG
MIEQPIVQQRSVESSDATVAQQQHEPDRNAHDAMQHSMDQNTQSSTNAGLEIAQHQIQFAVDKETRRTIIKIIDPQTKEVIRQIPPEEALRISRMISRIVRDRGAVTDERV